MHAIHKVALGFLCGALVSTAISASAADIGEPALSGFHRYTEQSRIKIKQHHCQEDEYMFIPSKRVSDYVNYQTPNRVFCAHPDTIRRAPLD